MTLSEAERLEGNEAIASTGKKLRPAIVIGVQAPNVASCPSNMPNTPEKVGADAIISLPLSENSDPKTDLEYYKAVGAATSLKGGTEQTRAETIHDRISRADVEVSVRQWLPICDPDHIPPECDLRTGCEAFCQRNLHKPRLIPLIVAAVVQIHALWCALSLPPRLRRCCHQSRPTAQLAAGLKSGVFERELAFFAVPAVY